jgi:hypothetical protein
MAFIGVVWGCRAPAAPAQQVDGAWEGPTAFVDIAVVPMDREVVLRGQTVLVVNGVITEVGPAGSVTIPDDAVTVDGTGKYLMPGLADLHVHIRHEVDLPVYLAHGVTTILDMGAPSRLLGWRDRLASGDLAGPQLLVSYFIDGPDGRANVVNTTEEARAAIRNAAASGYDYIKVYNSLTSAQFAAIIEEARAAGLAVIGHGVRQPGMEGILQGGQVMIAHGEEYIYTFFGNTIERSRIPAAVALTKRFGAYVLPNLSAFEIITLQWGKPAVVDSFLRLPEVRYLHPSYHESWQRGRYTRRRGSLVTRLAFLKDLTLAFAQADVPLLLGSDSPGIPGMFPGASIHNDLRNMVDAGLTPYQALTAGTRTAGEFARRTRSGSPIFGVVAPGSRADLMLVADNPLEDVANVRSPEGVMVAGRWWTADDLHRHLQSLYGGQAR